MSPGQNIEDVAALWLSRRTDDGWEERDEAALRDWLDESVTHAAAFWRLEHVWQGLDRVSDDLSQVAAPDLAGRRPPAWTWRQAAWSAMRRYGGGAVAAVVLVMSGLLLVPYLRQPPPVAVETYSTEIGQIATVQLRDGTSVSLNSETRVRIAQSEGRRTMWLDRGEAYLEVAADPSRPFTVLAGNGEVVVVGTKFTVAREGREAEVTVLEGKVRLQPASGGAAGHLALTPGDVGRTKDNTLLLTTTDLQRLRDDLAWQTGMVVFNDTPLEQAVAEFNRYNQRKIRLATAQARGMRIGGSFKLGNIEGFVRLLSRAYKLEVTIGDDEITIS